MLFGIFSKLTQRKKLDSKFAHHASDTYLYVLFPITVAFLITFITARLISHLDPGLYLMVGHTIHIHHYSYGILILAASGYLALIAVQPRDKYLVALLHGMGLGLAFDEFGIWLRLSANSADRFSYDGVLILVALFLLILSMRAGIRMMQVGHKNK